MFCRGLKFVNIYQFFVYNYARLEFKFAVIYSGRPVDCKTFAKRLNDYPCIVVQQQNKIK